MPASHRLHERCGCASAHSEHQWTNAESQMAGGRPFPLPSSVHHYERDRPFNVSHLALALTLDVPNARVFGVATIQLTRIDADADRVALDAVGFELKGVTVSGVAADYTYDGKVIDVSVPKGANDVTLAVEYSATPRRGLYFLEPDAHYPKRPRQVWSQCQEEDARYWFPCHDKPHQKMTTELRLTVPNGWSVLSNGELVSKAEPPTGDWSFHWKMNEPHPSYLVTLVAGEFAEIRESLTLSDRELPITYLVPRGQEADGKRAFGRTPDMIRLFGQKLGVEYPWNKYAQVVVSDFIFGGMENTTATTMYEYILYDERAALDVTSDDLVAHELAHQWFGDLVTCRDWSEGWLNEGFATFFEHIWKESHLGKDEYFYGIKGDLDAYASEASGRYKRPVVFSEYDAPLDLFDRHLYEKGGLVLHALREEVGDGPFFRGVNHYLTRHARGVVETRDLIRAIEEVSGKGLGRFFDQWIYKPGHPQLDIRVGWERGILTVQVKQDQHTTDGVPSVFELPIVIELHGSKFGVRRELVRTKERHQTFAFPCAERPSFVVVDPEMRVIGEVSIKMANDMLRAQLASAPTARGRWLAADALSLSDDSVTVKALAAALVDETQFWGTRISTASALGKIRGAEAFAALKGALSIKHPKVRRAVVSALGGFRTAAAFDALRPLALHDESYLVEAEAARAIGKTREPGAFDVLIDVMDRPSWADVIRAGAIDGLAALGDDRVIPHISARTRYGHPARARRAAILALPKVSTDKKTLEQLEQLLDDTNPIVRADVVRALRDFGDPKVASFLRTHLARELDSRTKRVIREALRDLHEPKRGIEPLKDDLEKLRGEHQELRARLAQLEARIAEDKNPAGKPAAAKKSPPRGPAASKAQKTKTNARRR